VADRPRLVVVAHSHHRTTGSVRFMQELLGQRYEVHTLWDDSWQPEKPRLTARRIRGLAPERLLYWQQLPPFRVLRRLSDIPHFWAPMRDGIRLDASRWRRLGDSGLPILSFCRELSRLFSGYGLPVLPLRYAPSPAPVPEPSGDEILFWVRRRDPGWPTLKRLLGDWRPDRIWLRLAPDPGAQVMEPDAADCKAYRIEIVRGWLDAASYAELRNRCGLFVAPRRLEGIGIASLEAMAAGRAVIAPDAATMNEYIRHQHNGYLYDADAPRPLALHDWRTVGRQAAADVAAWHEAWRASLPALIDFLDTWPHAPRRWRWRALTALLL
jgi:hypothetical protein